MVDGWRARPQQTPCKEHAICSMGSIFRRKAINMIDPPSQPPGSSERKLELEQVVDFAVGWSKVEFLTAVLDAADARLSTLEDERSLAGVNEAQEPDMDAPS